MGRGPSDPQLEYGELGSTRWQRVGDKIGCPIGVAAGPQVVTLAV